MSGKLPALAGAGLWVVLCLLSFGGFTSLSWIDLQLVFAPLVIVPL